MKRQARGPGATRPSRRARLAWGVVAGAALAAALAAPAARGWSRWRGRDASAVASAYKAGRTAVAERALARWRARDPGSAEAQLWRARLALAARRMGEAAEALGRAEALGADRAGLERLRAVALAFAGQFPRAEPTLREAFNAGRPTDPLVCEALTRIYLESYDLFRARVALARWVAEAPHDPKPYLWKAEADTRTGDDAAVTADFRAALSRDPRSAPALLGLAEVSRKAHRNAEASAFYDSYVKLRPDDPAGHLGAGRNAAELGDLDAARRHLTRASELAPKNAEARRALGDVLTRQGRFVDALAELDRASGLDPYDLEICYSRGRLLARLGRAGEAKAETARAAKLRADLDALAAAQTRLVAAPGDLEARLTLTRWMFSHGKADEGVRWAEAVLRDRPAQPDACRLLADHYARSGQPGLANLYRAQAEGAR